MSFTVEQQRLLAIAPRISAPLSMVGSACIVKSTLAEIFSGKATTYHRLLLSMSCIDFVTSFWYGLSTLPIPEGTPGVWAPSGTTTTCTVQGFFTQLSLAIPVYNGFLAIYYLLIGRYRWTEDRTRSVEPFMHVTALCIGGGGAISGLPLKLYNNANLWCWFAPFPLKCKDSFRYGQEANCIRGDNAWIYRYAFAYGPVWVSLIVAAVSLLLVYITVVQQEKDVDRYRNDGIATRTKSKRVAIQSFWYLSAFLATWLPGSITRVLQAIPSTRGFVVFPIILCMAIFLPMQGFLNFIVYFRARYVKYRKENPHSTVCSAVWNSSFGRGAPKSSDESERNVQSSSGWASSGWESGTQPDSQNYPSEQPEVGLNKNALQSGIM